MAEKIKIAELSIDTKQLLTELESTKKSLDSLTKAQKELKDAGDTSSKTYIKNEAELKTLRTAYNGQIKTLQAVSGGVDKLRAELDKEVRSIKEAKDQNSILRRIRDEVNVETEEGQKLLQELNERIDQNTELTKTNTDAISKQKSNVGNYTESINKAKIGVKAFGLALKAAGIGLAVMVFAKLAEAVGKNEKVMVLINTAMNALSTVLQPLISAVVDGAAAAYEATGGFSALGKVVGSLMTLGLTPLKIAFYAVKDAILSAQLGYEKLFGSDERVKELTKDLEANRTALKEMRADAGNAGAALVDNFSKAAKEAVTFGKSITDSVSGAVDKLSEQDILGNAFGAAKFEQEVKKIDAARAQLQLQFQLDAEKLRQIRDDDTLSMGERQKANADLLALQTKQLAAEQALIQQKVDGYAKILQINQDDTDAQVALLDAKTELIDAEERITGTMSEGLTNRNALRKEEATQVKEVEVKKTEAQIQAEKDRQQALNELKKQFADKAAEDEERDTQAKIDAFYTNQEAEIERLIADETLKNEYKRNLRAAWDEETAAYNKDQQDKAATQLQKDVEAYTKAEQAKIDARRNTVDAITGLFDAETAVGKAALIAKQIFALREWTIDQTRLKAKASTSAKGATAALGEGMAQTAKVGFPWNIPLIAGFIAQTIGIVSTIKNAISGSSAPTFAKGGLLQGASHANGGIQTPYGELEGNEAVINKRSTYKYGGLLSAINMAEGGNPIGNYKSNGLIDYDVLASKIAEANMSLPAPRVGVDEISSVGGRVVEIQERARF